MFPTIRKPLIMFLLFASSLVGQAKIADTDEKTYIQALNDVTFLLAQITDPKTAQTIAPQLKAKVTALNAAQKSFSHVPTSQAEQVVFEANASGLALANKNFSAQCSRLAKSSLMASVAQYLSKISK